MVRAPEFPPKCCFNCRFYTIRVFRLRIDVIVSDVDKCGKEGVKKGSPVFQMNSINVGILLSCEGM